MDKYYTIDELAKETGVPTRTIRYYTQEKLLAPPAKFAGRKALYGDRHVAAVKLIRILKEDCYLPLNQIRSVINNPAKIVDFRRQLEIKPEILAVLGYKPPRFSAAAFRKAAGLSAVEMKTLKKLGFLHAAGNEKESYSDNDLDLVRNLKKLLKFGWELEDLAFLPKKIESLAEAWINLGRRKMLPHLHKTADPIKTAEEINYLNKEIVAQLLQKFMRRSIAGLIQDKSRRLNETE